MSYRTEELNEMSNEACTCEDWCSASVHCCAGRQGLAPWAHCPPVAAGTIKLSLHSTQSGLGKGTEIACAIISPCYSPAPQIENRSCLGEDLLIQPVLGVAMGGISISKQVSMPSPQKSEGMFDFHSCDRHPAGEILRFGLLMVSVHCRREGNWNSSHPDTQEGSSARRSPTGHTPQ